MDHLRILCIEPSSVILSKKMSFKSLKCDAQCCVNTLKPNGCCNRSKEEKKKKYNFN